VTRLFWKIFLPFWVLQTCLLLLLFYRIHASFGPERPWWLQPERRAMPVLAHAAVKRYTIRGAAELKEQLQDMALERRSQYWLFDEQLRELSGIPVSAGARAAIEAALRNEGIARARHSTFLAERVLDAGHVYVFAGEFNVPPVMRSFSASVIVAVLIGSLFTSMLCALLAESITRPILRLRDAAHAISRGNLDARAGLEDSNRQDEIAELVRDFDAMARDIRDLVESNRRMLTGVSHDLRSPIARIRVALSLASTASESEREELLARIEDELLRLNSMIEQILTVARLESGQFRLATEPLPLKQVVGEAVEDARFEASQSDVEIVYDDRWPEVVIVGEHNMLRSAVENVLRNAIFYSGANGVVEVSVTAGKGSARITVRDNGPGVPESALPNLFRPFYRVDDARGSSTGGTGLGLSIVSAAVKMHQGAVSARNLQPHGLEVVIELPVSTEPNPVRSTSQASA